jgi:hypothetical protein
MSTTPGNNNFNGAALIGAAFTFLLRTFELVCVTISWFFFILSTWPLAVLFVLSILYSITFMSYSAPIIENMEYFMRCEFYPWFQGIPTIILEFVRTLFNPLVCWYDGVVWTPYGIGQEVQFPLLLRCGLVNALKLFANTLYTFFTEFVIGYILTFHFLSIPFDYGNTCSAWTASWAAWQQISCCMCQDLCVFVRLQPILLPNLMPNPLALLGSNMYGDANTCCAVFETVNGAFSAWQIVWRLIMSLLTLTVPAVPSFDATMNFFCHAAECWVKAMENQGQYFMDEFIPFAFDFSDVLCFLNTSFCVLCKFFVGWTDILFNINLVRRASSPLAPPPGGRRP